MVSNKSQALALLHVERHKGSLSRLSDTHGLFEEISELHALVGTHNTASSEPALYEDSPQTPLPDSLPSSPAPSSPQPSSPERSPSGSFLFPYSTKLQKKFRQERQVSEKRQTNEVNLGSTMLGTDLALQKWEEQFQEFLKDHETETHGRIQNALSADWAHGDTPEEVKDYDRFIDEPSFSSQTPMVARTVRFTEFGPDDSPAFSQPTSWPSSSSRFASQPTLRPSPHPTPKHLSQPTPRPLSASSSRSSPFLRFASQPTSQPQTPHPQHFFGSPAVSTPSQMVVKASSTVKKTLIGSQETPTDVKRRKTGF